MCVCMCVCVGGGPCLQLQCCIATVVREQQLCGCCSAALLLGAKAPPHSLCLMLLQLCVADVGEVRREGEGGICCSSRQCNRDTVAVASEQQLCSGCLCRLLLRLLCVSVAGGLVGRCVYVCVCVGGGACLQLQCCIATVVREQQLCGCCSAALLLGAKAPPHSLCLMLLQLCVADVGEVRREGEGGICCSSRQCNRDTVAVASEQQLCSGCLCRLLLRLLCVSVAGGLVGRCVGGWGGGGGWGGSAAEGVDWAAGMVVGGGGEVSSG